MALHQQTNAQDWADLNYYRNANTLLENPAENEDRVVFMGNSITEFWKTFTPISLLEKPTSTEASVDRPLLKCSFVSVPMW